MPSSINIFSNIFPCWLSTSSLQRLCLTFISPRKGKGPKSCCKRLSMSVFFQYLKAVDISKMLCTRCQAIILLELPAGLL